MTLYAFEGKRPVVPASAWIAPSAELIGDVRLGENVSIWFNVVIRGDNTPIVIGARTNVQEGTVMHSDVGSPLIVGEGVTVGHRAILHGCEIANHVLIGMGATVLNHAYIGEGCLIGANALITEGKRFEPRSMIVGAPGKAVRMLDDREVQGLKESAEHYVTRAKAFRSGLSRMNQEDEALHQV